VSSTLLTRLGLTDRLNAARAWLLTHASSKGLAVFNALALLTCLVLVVGEKSVLTGFLIVAWGAGASVLAYQAGAKAWPNLTLGRVAVAYFAATAALYLLRNGVYKLLGM
jgi:hypothetical protein